MKPIHSIEEVVQAGLCISCGACVSAAPEDAVSLVLTQRQSFTPRVNAAKLDGQDAAFRVCPGKGVPIRSLTMELYGSAPFETFELGRYRVAAAWRSTSEEILRAASSGGVMTAVAQYLLQKGLIQGVTASRLIYGSTGPVTQSFVARSRADLLTAQGSKYCPTTTNVLVRSCMKEGGRYLFCGTPCQVAALRLAARDNPDINRVFPYTMANFCGGFRPFEFLDDIIVSLGIPPRDIHFFRFRGGGQPGSLLACAENGRSVTEPYPDYIVRSTVPKMKRCWYCLDATGELADFACGDAWLPRFLRDSHGWSIVLGRSSFAETVLQDMVHDGHLIRQEVSCQEICQSQKSNITSKKYRQHSRIRVSRFMRIQTPEWDVELPRMNRGMIHEFRILLGKSAVGRRVSRLRRLVRGIPVR